MGRLNPEIYSVSHTEMATYKECKRKWMLQYYLKLRRRREPKAVARDTGTLVHAALHTFYLAGGLGGGEAAEKLMLTHLSTARDADMLKENDEEERAKVVETHDVSKIVCKGYLEWLHETGADIGYKFDKMETELRAPGPIEGTEIMGIIDLGGTHEQSGDLFVMDTKVIASIDDTLKTLHIMEQAPMYAVLAKINDPDTSRGFRVVWNMLKRNKHTKAAKPPFYQRYELAINSDQLRQFYMQLQGQIAEILRTEERLNNGVSHVEAAYPTPTTDCAWKCPYFQICGVMNDLVRNDADYLINAYYTTPKQRADAKVEEAKEKQRQLTLQTQEEGIV